MAENDILVPRENAAGGFDERVLTAADIGAVASNDARLTDARTPTSHTHGNLSNAGAIGTTANLPVKTGTSGVLEAGAFGTAAGQFAEGNHTHTQSAITDTATYDVTFRSVTAIGPEVGEGIFDKGLFVGNAIELSPYTLPDPADELPYIKFNGFMSGSTALRPYSGSGNFNINLPDASGTLALTTLLGASAELVIACSDETSNLTTGTAKVTFRMPYAMTLSSVRASVNTAPTGSTLIVDINEGGSTILSTKLSIDASELTSTTAATAAVISDIALADDASITIDIDQIGSTIAGKGLKVVLKGVRA
jgi:hypothetical protein